MLTENINGYLINAPNVEVHKSFKPISNLPEMDFGSKPVDGGHLILSEKEKTEILEIYPRLKRNVRRYVGSQELIKGIVRHCLWINESELIELQKIDFVRTRLNQVRNMRLKSGKKQTQEFAEKPYRFGEIRHRETDLAITVAAISSENREYLPAAALTDNEIINNKCYVIYGGPLWALSLLVSKLHIVWIGAVCVRLEERFSYSNTIGWNTFPFPVLDEKQLEKLHNSARNILLVRENHFPKSIAELYDKKSMPDDLRKAHLENDQLIESFYQDEPFESDDERLAHLFERYVEMTKGIDQ